MKAGVLRESGPRQPTYDDGTPARPTGLRPQSAAPERVRSLTRAFERGFAGGRDRGRLTQLRNS